MGEIIAFVSVKGGVGKTTIALETAANLVHKFNKKVLLVDGNFSAPNIGLYLNVISDYTLHNVLDDVPLHNSIYEAFGIDIVPASLHFNKKIDTSKLKKILSNYKKRYDFIILDSSPNYEELKSVISASDKVFIITSPDDVTLRTSLKAVDAAKEERVPIEGIVVNKIRSPKHEYNLSQIEEISEIPVLAKIRDSKKIIESSWDKKPISIEYPNNRISKEISRFASALCGESEFQNKINQRLLTLISKEKVNRDIYRNKYYESQIKSIPISA